MSSVIITGASGGIGRSAALAFAARGFDITAAGFTSADALSSLEHEIRAVGCGILTMTGDVSDPAFIEKLTEETVSAFGGIDVLVNNAGIARYGLIQDMTPEDFDRIMAVNVKSVFLATRSVIPHFLKKQSGSIVNVSSVWGIAGGSTEVLYSASKGAINAFTKAAARELGPSGIRVNAAAFGAIDTKMNAHLSDEDRSLLYDEIALGRMGTPEEAGEFIFDLAVNHPYLTGQVITFDGGWI